MTLSRAALPPSRRTQLRSKPIVQLIGLIVVSLVAIGGAIDGYRASTPVPLAAARLATDPPLGYAVRVTCTARVIDPGVQIAGDDDGGDVQYIALCPLGDRALVVVSDAPVRDGELAGKLLAITGDEVWAGARSRLGAIHSAAYLDLTSQGQDRLVGLMVTLLGLGAIAGWWFFARRMLRRRQAA